MQYISLEYTWRTVSHQLECSCGTKDRLDTGITEEEEEWLILMEILVCSLLVSFRAFFPATKYTQDIKWQLLFIFIIY